MNNDTKTFGPLTCNCEAAGVCWSCQKNEEYLQAAAWFCGALRQDISNESQTQGYLLAEAFNLLVVKLANRDKEVDDLRKAGEELWKFCPGISDEQRKAMEAWSLAYLYATK